MMYNTNIIYKIKERNIHNTHETSGQGGLGLVYVFSLASPISIGLLKKYFLRHNR